MENLGAMAYSRYTGFRKITDRDVLELHCISVAISSLFILFEVLWQWHFLGISIFQADDDDDGLLFQVPFNII